MSNDHHFVSEDDAVAGAERTLYREGARLTAGASAFHQLDPSEIAMRMEEYDPRAQALLDRANLRNEIFSGFAEYLFADGPAPECVRARVAGFLAAYAPELAERISGAQQWCAAAEVTAVMIKYRKKLVEMSLAACSRGALSTWSRDLEAEEDAECVRQTLAGLVEFLTSEGSTWRSLVAVAYCLAKALRPALIGGMSLEDIARLSGDQGGRATPCNRVKRLYNRRIEAAGGRKGAQVHFQKSCGTVAKYAEAQAGNSNRKTKRKHKKP